MKVLVADPDEATRAHAAACLVEFGYRSVLTSGPDDTRRAIDDDEPDVILVGTGIAETDIGSVCRLVRDRESGGYRYVIALVDPADTESLQVAMLSGADDFLLRPLVAEQFHARLQVAERFALLYRQLRDQRAALDRAGSALRTTARTDTLTHLGNQRQLDDDLALFEGQLRRYGHRYVAGTFDLDNLRGYLETYGRLAADEALRLVAETVLQNLRTGDRAYRCDDTALVVLLPEQTPESARIAAKRIREAVAALAISHAGNPPWNILTLSAGIAAIGPEDHAQPSAYRHLLDRATAALAQASRQGGNRVVVSEAEPA